VAFGDPGHDSVTDFSNLAASDSTAQRHSNYMGGTEAARGLLNSPDSYSGGLSYGDSAVRDAIRQKGVGSFNQSQNRLSIETLKRADQDHVKKLEVASQMANEEFQMNMQKEILRKKQAQAKQMARGAMVGSVLGIVGAVGGASVPGAGVGGAIAGNRLGEGFGTAIGSGL
jgi:hypothetical protein